MVKSNQELLVIPHEKLKWVSIKLTEIFESGRRLEASIFDPEAKRIRKIISKSKHKKKPFFDEENGFAKDVFYPGRFRRIFVDKGEPIYDPSDILFYLPNTSKQISKKTKIDFNIIRLKENQIVLTRSGSVGNCSVVSRILNGKLFSDDLIRITLADENDMGYIYTFIQTSIGNKLITTHNYGSVISHLEPEHLSAIDVPIPDKEFRNKIQIKIKKVCQLRDEANILLKKADELFHRHLHLKKVSDLKPKYFHPNSIRNFSLHLNEINQRFDASYHLPIIEEIISQLKKSDSELTTIGDKRVSEDIILPGRFKRIYVDSEHGVPFLGSKEILLYFYPKLKYLSIKNHEKRIKNELTLKENMIAITCSGTVGRTILLPKYMEGWAGSQHSIRILPSTKMNPGYLYAFLASDYGYELIRRFQYGTNVDEIDDEHVSKITIPLPKKTVIMDEIGNLVLKANRNRNEAYNLEQESINLVENMILMN